MQTKQFLSQSISSANKSPLNTSKSKAMFTFPKEERFPTLHSESKHQFYQKPTLLGKRAPSFGYGHKVDITLKNNSPSPDKYTIPSELGKNIKAGLTIAQGRDDCKFISIFNQTHNPGPGQYQIANEKENKKPITMSPKTKFPSLWSSSIAPGPGAYDVQKIDTHGFCLTSKYETKNGFKIHPKVSETTNSNPLELIGPGKYETNIPSTGKQILAHHKTEKAFHFSKKVRETLNEVTLSPGPGAYKHFSVFGLV